MKITPLHDLKIYGPTTIEINHIVEYTIKSDPESPKNGALDINENCRKYIAIKEIPVDIPEVKTAD